jgi:flagellar motor component MotA
MKAFSHVVAALFVLGLAWLGTMFSGVRLIVYLDAASLVLVLGLTLVMLRAGWSFKAMGAQFRNSLDDQADKPALEEAILFFTSARRYLALAAGFAVFIGLIAILTHLTDQSKLGPNLAVALLSAFYAIILTVAVCVPLETAARRRLVNSH